MKRLGISIFGLPTVKTGGYGLDLLMVKTGGAMDEIFHLASITFFKPLKRLGDSIWGLPTVKTVGYGLDLPVVKTVGYGLDLPMVKNGGYGLGFYSAF